MRQPDCVDATIWARGIRHMFASEVSASAPVTPAGKGWGAGGKGGASAPASPAGHGGVSPSPAWSHKSAPAASMAIADPAGATVSDQGGKGGQVSDQDAKRLRLSDAPQHQQASTDAVLQYQRRVTDLRILLDESEDEIKALREQLKTTQAHGKMKTETIHNLEERLLERVRTAVDLREPFQ